MKTIKLVVLSLICSFFCSCHPNYEKLIPGKWRVDVDASYNVEKGKRNYFSEVRKDKLVCDIEFLDNGEVLLKQGNGETAKVKYHFDGDYFFIGGDGAHVLKMNSKRMIIEGNEGDPYDFVHAELDRVDYDSWSMWWKSMRCHVPWWVWAIVLFGLFIVGKGADEANVREYAWIAFVVLAIIFFYQYIILW